MNTGKRSSRWSLLNYIVNIKHEVVVGEWCNPLTLKPEQSGGVGSIPGRIPPHERHDPVGSHHLSVMKTLQTLYTGIVELHFRYCCSVWGCAGSSDIDQLQKLQKRAARIITNSIFDAQSRPLIEELGWQTVEQLISSESKTMVFKSLNELAPQYLCDLFTRNLHCSSYSLRNTGTDLRLPMKRSNNGQKCFSYRGAKLWNSLSAESKQATSLHSFKKTI